MPIVNFNNVTAGLNANARQHSHYIVNADSGDAGIWVTKTCCTSIPILSEFSRQTGTGGRAIKGKINMRAMMTVLAFMVLNVPTSASAQEAWYPSQYGPGDTKGAMNNLSPEGAVAAAKLVKTGKV